MTYVVVEDCIKCKHTDCVDVCPVDCFRGGTVKTGTSAPVSFGKFQYSVSSSASLKTSCYAWHDILLFPAFSGRVCHRQELSCSRQWKNGLQLQTTGKA